MSRMGGLGVVEADREGDGFLQGLAVGVVTDNKDPDGLSRVRVKLPWQAKGDTSYWARIATPMAGPDRGAYFLPEIDDEVLVGAEGGDPSHLYVLGAVWNGKQKPLRDNADGKNDHRLIKSRAGHQLLFDDGDKPVVELKLADGKRLVMDDDGVIVEDGQGNKLTISTGSAGIVIESGATLKLKSQSISIEAGASLTIKAAGTLTIQGALVKIN